MLLLPGDDGFAIVAKCTVGFDVTLGPTERRGGGLGMRIDVAPFIRDLRLETAP